MLNYSNVFNPYSPSGRCVYSTDKLEKGVFKKKKEEVSDSLEALSSKLPSKEFIQKLVAGELALNGEFKNRIYS